MLSQVSQSGLYVFLFIFGKQIHLYNISILKLKSKYHFTYIFPGKLCGFMYVFIAKTVLFHVIFAFLHRRRHQQDLLSSNYTYWCHRKHSLVSGEKNFAYQETKGVKNHFGGSISPRILRKLDVSHLLSF